jgi:hypothetical protein
MKLAIPAPLLLAAITLAAATSRAAEPATAPCTTHGDMNYVCGPWAAEDLVRVEGTPWLLASGFAQGTQPGHVQLIDTHRKAWEIAWPLGNAPRVAHDAKQFPACATPPDLAKFSAHGIALRGTGAGKARLLVVNHGGREAVEFFDVDASQGKPVLTWIGCVTMPEDVFLNSVVQLPQGGFLATKFYAPSKGGMSTILQGQITGGVLEWLPGKMVTEIAGTQLVGANGIEQADNGRIIYVAEWGKRAVVRFDRRGGALKKDVVTLDFSPDNLRWAPDGNLLAAGQKMATPTDGRFEMLGWGVASIAPASLAVKGVYSADGSNPLTGVSVGVVVDGTLWVGPFRGDRVGYVPLPAR